MVHCVYFIENVTKKYWMQFFALIWKNSSAGLLLQESESLTSLFILSILKVTLPSAQFSLSGDKSFLYQSSTDFISFYHHKGDMRFDCYALSPIHFSSLASQFGKMNIPVKI
jgi:hypothetical protein